MKMDVWVDFICPYCYVSTMTLDKALKETGAGIEYVHHGYLLDPDLKAKPGESHIEWMAGHLGMTVEEAKKSLEEGIGQKAKNNGVEFHPEKAIPAKTKDAHLLAYLASEKGLGQKAVVWLSEAYYRYGENLADDATLERIAEEIGLGADALEVARSNPKYEEQLNEDRMAFRTLEIESIPHYVINDDTVLPGSKNTDEFVAILEKYK